MPQGHKATKLHQFNQVQDYHLRRSSCAMSCSANIRWLKKDHLFWQVWIIGFTLLPVVKVCSALRSAFCRGLPGFDRCSKSRWSLLPWKSCLPLVIVGCSWNQRGFQDRSICIRDWWHYDRFDTRLWRCGVICIVIFQQHQSLERISYCPPPNVEHRRSKVRNFQRASHVHCLRARPIPLCLG